MRADAKHSKSRKESASYLVSFLEIRHNLEIIAVYIDRIGTP
jgi:hypothetical protein